MAQLAIEDPIFGEIKQFDAHKELATELASMLPDYMTVTLEPVEDTQQSKLTISVQYKATIVLIEDEIPTASILKNGFINAYKNGVNNLDASS